MNKKGENEIYSQWKEIWKKECADTGKAICSIETSAKKLFLDKFDEAYSYVIEKDKYNKKMNFRMKTLFLCIFSVGIVSCIIFEIWSAFFSQNIVQNLIQNGLLLFAVFLVAMIVGKWIDMKKYQETWIRHSEHKHMLEREMLLYILKLEPYHVGDAETIFMERTIQIWDANHKKFVDNMENKEKDMMDIFEYIQLKQKED